MAPYLLGIDVGTGACKTVLFDAEGRIRAVAQEEYPLAHPHPGWAEQEAGDWWRAAVVTIRRVLSESGISPASIAGIGIDAQSAANLPVTVDGTPLESATLYIDKRSEGQCTRVEHQFGSQRALAITGNPIGPYSSVPRIAWLKEKRPQVYAAAHKFLTANGYLVYQLTGEFSLDVSQAAFTNVYDLHKGRWSEALCRAYGIEVDKLPRVYQCAEPVGCVTRRAARETGLAPGTRVIAGAMDLVAAATGVGAIEPRQAVSTMGTCFAMAVCSSHPIVVSALYCLPAAVPGRWYISGGVDAAGGALRWFRDTFGVANPEAGTGDIHAFNLLTQEAAQASPGAGGLIFLPYMAGLRVLFPDPHARGVFVGLTMSTRRAEVIRAIMEGVVFGVRHQLEAMENAGAAFDELLVTGGGSRSELWVQMMADIVGCRTINPQMAEAATLGVALLAGVAAGVYPDLRTAVSQIAARRRLIIEPDPARQALYDGLFHVYAGFYSRLKDSFRQLARWAEAQSRPLEHPSTDHRSKESTHE